jgi:hypothetical protein
MLSWIIVITYFLQDLNRCYRHFILLFAGQFLKRSAMLVINQDPAVHLVGKARAPAQSSTPAVAREMISGMVTVFCYIEPGSLRLLKVPLGPCHGLGR